MSARRLSGCGVLCHVLPSFDCSAGNELQRCGGRFGRHHRIDVRSAMARILGAIGVVDGAGVGVTRFLESHVSLHAAGTDPPFVVL